MWRQVAAKVAEAEIAARVAAINVFIGDAGTRIVRLSERK